MVAKLENEEHIIRSIDSWYMQFKVRNGSTNLIF